MNTIMSSSARYARSMVFGFMTGLMLVTGGSAWALPKVASLEILGQSVDPVPAGSNTVFQFRVFRGTGTGSSGAFQGDMLVSNTLPAGVTVTFSPTSLSFSPSENVKTGQMTVAVSPSLRPTSFSICVRCEKNADTSDFAGSCGANVTVLGSNTVPVAVTDSITVNEDSGATVVDVLSNDTDADSDPLTVTSVTQPANGVSAVGGGGAHVTYTPNLDYNGPDSFTYIISDGFGGTATGTVNVTVSPVPDDPVITTWPTASAITYGQTLASSTLSGGTASVPGTFAFTDPTIAPNAGTSPQSVTFTPDDTVNYNTVVSTVNVTVNKADPTVTTWPTASSITYGQTLASSILSGGDSSVPGTFAFTDPTISPSVGTAPQSVTFTPTDTANYNTVVSTVDVTVNKADPVVTTWPTASTITYGQTLADSNLTGGDASVPGTFAFTDPTIAPNAGTAPQSVTFTPTDTANYNTVANNVNVTVNPAGGLVTAWPTATAITFGQTLASSTLAGGTASVPGTFAFTDPTIAPNAGTAPQSVTFTPDDTVNYSPEVGFVDVTVNKANPVVDTWPTASAITYGQTLASSTLTGGDATPTGSFAFTNPTTAPGVGTSAQSVTFTPDDTANYNTLVGTVDVTVNKADPVVTMWPTASAITYGQTLADSNLTGGDASVPGTFAFTDPTIAPNAGTSAQSVTFTPTDTANYNTVVSNVDVTVNKANPVVGTLPTASTITSGQSLASSTLTGGAASVPGTFAFTDPTIVPGVGTADQSVTFTPDDTANYNTVTFTVPVTVEVGDSDPVAVNDSATVNEDSGATAIDVLSNDSDPNGDTLTITAVTQPANGAVVITGGGTGLTYQPNANFNGVDTFTYTISDGNGGTATATVTVSVLTVNDAPVAVADGYEVAEDDVLEVAAPGVLGNDSDVDGDTLTAVLVSDVENGALTLNSNGSFVYVPADNFVGTDSFTYQASDGTNLSAVVTVTINVVSIRGAGDVDLYARALIGSVNWALHGHGIKADKLILRGALNPRGANLNLNGATVELTVNGVKVLDGAVLDSKGRFAGSQPLADDARFTLKARNGRYVCILNKADLRGAYDLPNLTGSGKKVLAVQLKIAGAGLEVPVVSGQLEADYATQIQKITALKFGFKKHRTLTGAFNLSRTTAVESETGHVVSTRGAMLDEGSAPIVPSGDVVLHIGDETIEIPLASFAEIKGVYTYSAELGAVPGITKFVIHNKKRMIQITTSVLDELGLPASGDGAPTSAMLPLMVEIPTEDATLVFETIIELLRKTGTSPNWKR